MPIFTLTLAANVRCYRSDHQVEAENLDDLIAKMRAEASVGLHAALKPDWETMSDEMALDISDASGVTVAEDVMFGYVPPAAPAPVDASDIIDAAMCLWEAVLEDDLWADATDDMGGVCGKRDFCSGIAEECHRGWAIASDSEGFDMAFDWEFVPWFLKVCVDAGAYLGPELDADWREHCAMLALRCAADLEDAERTRAAATKASAAPDDECLPDAAWMLVVDLHGSQCGGTVWAFDDNAHQSAMDICNARGLRFGTLKVFGSKAVAALLELSEGMNDADELAFAQGGLDQ
jgi:hypothetical protein